MSLAAYFAAEPPDLVKFAAVTKQQIYDTSQNNPRRKQNHILRQRTQFVACDLSR